MISRFLFELVSMKDEIRFFIFKKDDFRIKFYLRALFSEESIWIIRQIFRENTTNKVLFARAFFRRIYFG